MNVFSGTAQKAPSYPVVLASCFTPVPVPLEHLLAFPYARRGADLTLVPTQLRDMRDIRVFGRHVAAVVQTTLARHRVPVVNLMGVSLGGLAALYAVKRLGLADRIAAFISIVSPFHGSTMNGTALASRLYTRLGCQLQPDGLFLTELHADPLPPGPVYTAFSGLNDLICPPPTAVLNGARNVFLPIGHAEVTVDTALHDLVFASFR